MQSSNFCCTFSFTFGVRKTDSLSLTYLGKIYSVCKKTSSFSLNIDFKTPSLKCKFGLRYKRLERTQRILLDKVQMRGAEREKLILSTHSGCFKR